MALLVCFYVRMNQAVFRFLLKEQQRTLFFVLTPTKHKTVYHRISKLIKEKNGWSLLLFLLLAHENLTCSGCNRSCFIPHDLLNKRVAVAFVLQRVRSSTHFTSDRMCLEYGGGRRVLISEP